MILQASYDNGATWISLSQYEAAVMMGTVKARGRFAAWLGAGYVVEKGGVDYRIAPMGE